ncbi:phage major capsid protein [Sinimarinibacterium flocculans]|uniref:phage major capsid protein n=1 Tax=Sinimarinibacterium flocculans TaxID=985250 RepID=UPI0024935B6C|nr:phage major capsid protein [Sinimarinibacterium flocculans]
MADTSTFSAAMKTKFIGPIRDGLHSGKVLLFGTGPEGGDNTQANPEDFKGIQRSAEGIDFVGNDFRIPLKATRNQAVGFRSENETLPAPGNSTYTYLTEPLRYAYGLFNITGQLLKASESNEGAFKQAFKQEMEDTVLTSKIDFNRAAFGDGTGSFTAVATNASSSDTTVVVSTTINFRGGEIIDFTTSGGTVVSAAHTVTGINRTTKTLTISPALAANVTAGTHFPVRASSDSTTSVPNNSLNKEIQGLQSIVASSGALHGVNPTTYAFWKSYQAAVGGGITDTVLRNAVDGIGFEAGADTSGNDFVMITTRGIRANYAATLTSLKQFVNAEAQTLRGGFKALIFDDHPIFVDDQCPVGNVFGLNLKDFFWAELADWDWMDQDGDVLKWESRKDRYVAILYKYCQLGVTRRNTHFRLTGVTDTDR